MIKTIIFDNNGVLVTSNEETGFKSIIKATRLSIEEFKPAYDKLAEEVDEGKITSRQFFKKVVSSFGLDTNPEKLQETIYGSFVRKKDTIDFVLDIRKKYELALLTNFGDAFWQLDKKWKITSLFNKNKVFVSCDLGMRKPQQDIFIYVLRSLKRKPSEVIFVDDKKENVIAAKKVGINGIVFKDIPRLKQDLQKYITI